MKYLQIELSDEQHGRLKAMCWHRDITIKSWLQQTVETALTMAEVELNPHKSKLYVAYGSNLNLGQMKFRCPTAKPLATTELPGYDLLFRGSDGHAVATVEPGEDTVPVLLWKLHARDEIALDRYEGFPHFYRKENIEVEVRGQTVSAMVYILNDGHPLGTPSNSYLDTILEGYDAAGFDADILQRALERSQPELVQNMEHDELSGMEWW